jgi:alpha-beta hydrolase superfamily lysophospholipase
MVAGSGPTDRDWNTPLLPGSNGSARLLAEALAENGFASLRYDKRAAGPHAAENFPKLMGKISMQSHVDELAGTVRFLASQEFCDRMRLFVLTNSEGALHALNYQVHDPERPFAGIVLTAPPGRVMSEVGRAQIVAQLSALPDGERLIGAYDAAIMQFQAGEPVTMDPAMPQGVEMLLQGLSAPVNQPFSRELWMADAAASLSQVSVPVLVVIGQKDIQVDWQADGSRLQAAVAGRGEIQFAFPGNANHVLKHEPRPRATLDPADVAARYNAPDQKLDPEVVNTILQWLAERI